MRDKTDKFIALMGLKDILVVNTKDVILVTKVSKSQRINKYLKGRKESLQLYRS